jgi:hypothetical protein
MPLLNTIVAALSLRIAGALKIFVTGKSYV